jgi:hypothetical protein
MQITFPIELAVMCNVTNFTTMIRSSIKETESENMYIHTFHYYSLKEYISSYIYVYTHTYTHT